VAVALATAGCGASGTGTKESGGAEGGFYTGAAPGGQPVAGGTATVDTAEAPTTLDPVSVITPGDTRPSTAIFDTLVELMPEENEPSPALAQSWTVSPDGKTYTFTLRPGVQFSNGEPLTAADVTYSLLRVKNLPISSCQTFTKRWRTIRSLGANKVEIDLDQPEPALIGTLTVPCFGIVPKALVEREGEKQFAANPVGTGPFIFKSTTPGNSKITLEKNPHYWRKGQPYLSGLIFNQVENENSRILAVRSGSAQIGLGMPYAQAQALESTPGVRMLVEPLWGSSINPINNTKPPLNNVEVRRALLYATPYSEIIQAVYKGYGYQTNGVWGKMKYWDSSVPPYPTDVKKAKELLANAGLPNGFSVTMQIQGGETGAELIAQILQSSWAKAGVKVDIQTLNSTTLYANLFSGKFELQLLPPEATGAEFYNPDGAVQSYLNDTELFPGEVPSKRLASQINTAVSTQSQTKRKELFQEIQAESYVKEPTWIPIVSLAALNLVTEAVHGFSELPNNHIRWDEVWLAH
jgi:peptide/nickel transport system substrate-binding protein